VLVDAVTEKDVEDITRALVDKARQGNMAAGRLVLAYAAPRKAPARRKPRCPVPAMSLTAARLERLCEIMLRQIREACQ
jgi:hypothetical protein